MKIYTFLGTVLLACLLLISCHDFLNELPKGEIVAKTTADYRKILDNADTRYTNNLVQVSSYVDVVSDNVQVPGEMVNDWTDRRLYVQNLYTFAEQVWTPDGPMGDDVWKQNYSIVTLVNNILKEICRADDNKKLQAQLIAEAKVHRAYAYLTLVNIYAKHYTSQTASSDLGVPVFQNSVELPDLTQPSVQKVYDYILKQLLSAVSDLPPDVSQYKHRPTKVSAFAILARTYLYMGNYEKALKYANKSLEIRNFLYDYNDIYTGTAEAENVKGISLMDDKAMLLLKTTMKGAGLRSYMILDSLSFNKLYSGYSIDPVTNEKNNEDLRRVLWFNTFGSGGSIYYRYVFSDSKHRYAPDNRNRVDYIPVTTSMMYLIRAECNARLGNLQLALDDINTLRMHRYKTDTYSKITVSDLNNSKQAVLEEVLLERRRELYGKELRLFDVKRLGLPVTHELGNSESSVPAHSPKLVWPIHYSYIELNPEMKQNPR